MWVLKLGGSLYRTPQLDSWLAALGQVSQPLLVVPGGGPFADTVRQAQDDWSLSEAAAHRMAILGMQQMALLLCDRQPRLEAVDSVEDIDCALAGGRVPVWLPDRMLQAANDIAFSWQVTSDSLAGWLAAQLNAEGLLLVKSAELEPGRNTVERLQRDGVLDAAFHRYRPAVPGWLLQRRHPEQLEGVLRGETKGLGILRLAPAPDSATDGICAVR